MSAVPASTEPSPVRSSVSEVVRALFANPGAALGVMIVAMVLAAAIGADWLAPHDPMATDFLAKLKPPLTGSHLLGTDQLGRDVLSRIIHGARISVVVGVGAALLAGVIGVAIGAISGFVGGFVDSLLMRIVDTFLSFPFVLLVLVVNAVLGGGLFNIVLSLAAGGWVVYARVVRGEVLALREKDFILAARATGLSPWRILAGHILPNLVTPVTLLASLQVSSFIVAEAAVSFLGFGIQPPAAAWGNMLSEGKDYIFTAWWLITFPGIAIVIAALGINLVGDWLRDTLDPESETRR